jgi:hypothetical protein
MNTSAKFLVAATQTAYLWTQRGRYGNRPAALRSLRRRRCATGMSAADCERAFDLGLAVTERARALISTGRALSEAKATRISDDVSRQVLRSVPGSTPEMVDYLLGMMLWMPLFR